MAEQRCMQCGATLAEDGDACPVCGSRVGDRVVSGQASTAAGGNYSPRAMRHPPRLGGRALLLALDGGLLLGALVLGAWLITGGPNIVPAQSPPLVVTPTATFAVPLLVTPTSTATPWPTPTATQVSGGSGATSTPTPTPTPTRAPTPTPQPRPSPTPTPTPTALPNR